VYSSNLIIEMSNTRQVFIKNFNAADELADRKGNVFKIAAAYEKACATFLQIPDINTDQDKEMIHNYLDCLDELLTLYEIIINFQIKNNLITDLIETKHKKTLCEQNQLLYNSGGIKTCVIEASVANWGFVCEETPMDGNCLFHAIAQQLYANNITVALPNNLAPHLALRELAVNHIRINASYYQKNLSCITIAEYVRKISKVGEWGDHFEIAALVRELNITLVLIQNDGDIHVFKTVNNKPVLYLGYDKDFHFMSLTKNTHAAPNPELSLIISAAAFVEMENIQLHLQQPQLVQQPRILLTEAKPSSSKKPQPPSSSAIALLSLRNFFSFLKSTNRVDPIPCNNRIRPY
jgi:hypothetical protein